MLALTILVGCEIETHSPDEFTTYRTEFRKRGHDIPSQCIIKAMTREQFDAYWGIEKVLIDIDTLKSMGNNVDLNKYDDYIDSVDAYMIRLRKFLGDMDAVEAD